MIYMNAKNNLECAALSNFAQMAQVGSSDRVNILVELGRPVKERHTNDEQGWSGVLRFRVTQGMHPIPASAIDPDDSIVRNADMGNATTLDSFVRWAKENYAANKYMLVIWNHGQGWRLYQADKLPAVPNEGHLKNVSFGADDQEPQPCQPSQQELVGGVRSVSFDADTGSFLYNRDIETTLKGQQLDILGFDACLMAMIESAYAFRDVARIMIASEELVPGDGWNYVDWMTKLIGRPEIEADTLASEVVDSYRKTYGEAGSTTMSAVDLARVSSAVKSLAAVSLLIKSKIQTEGPFLAYTRASFRTFGDWYQDSWQDCQGSKVLRFHGIDLSQFLHLYALVTKDAKIQGAIAETEKQIEKLFIRRYASSVSAGADHWSTGIAIYFPSSELDFQCDSDKDGYDVEAVRAGLVKAPPEFVELKGWSDLLHAYLESRLSPQPRN